MKMRFFILLNKKNIFVFFIFLIIKNMLPEPSEEQIQIVNKISTNNIVVDSVAGSGKTTTNLYIALHHSDVKILLLTYNARLKDETRKKVKDNKINNLEVHSYHSFCVKYYHHKCFDDDIMKQILKNDTTPLQNFKFDVIIVDEAQDMNKLYFNLVKKIFKDNDFHETRICIIGDKYQCIYDKMKGANPKYITNAENEFTFNSIPWIRLKLSQSFRLTNNIANFVNKIMLHEDRIIASKQGVKVKYVVCENIYNEPYPYVKKFIKDYKYNPEDIFIIAPSVKNNAKRYGVNKSEKPINVLENCIKRYLKIPVYATSSNEEKLDQDIIDGKLVISTIHQTKGLERKVVFYIGFDSSYFKFNKRHASQDICPNELYVATTRSSKILYLFHNKEFKFLPFINHSMINNCSEVIGKLPKFDNEDKYETHTNFFNRYVSEVAKYVPDEIIDECYSLLEIEQLRSIGQEIVINTKTSQGTMFESVSDINGILIPLAYNLFLHGVEIDISNLVDSALEIWSNSTGYVFKKDQITDFNWISLKELNDCFNRLSSLNINKDATFEKKLTSIPFKFEPRDFVKLHGIVDCIHNDNVYEFKCVKKLRKEHFLQLAIYAYMLKNKKYYLYNIITNELYQICCSDENLDYIVKTLLKKSINHKE